VRAGLNQREQEPPGAAKGAVKDAAECKRRGARRNPTTGRQTQGDNRDVAPARTRRGAKAAESSPKSEKKGDSEKRPRRSEGVRAKTSTGARQEGGTRQTTPRHVGEVGAVAQANGERGWLEQRGTP